MTVSQPRVGLFVTCLVDFFRPTVGLAAVKLLQDAGCLVEIPALQTCCGQPAYNNGDRANAKKLARQVVDAFAHYDYVVVPSGSCAGMLSQHLPLLFLDEPQMQVTARDLAAKTYELIAFLTDVLEIDGVRARYEGVVTYHDACAGLRELGIKQQPRKLLADVENLELKEMADTETCCGFGGTFCVKYSDISDKILEKKLSAAEATGADTLLAGDLGCLLNIAGKLTRQGSKIRVRHVAEVLADMTSDCAPIGHSES